jgi:hypothetical protein
MPVLKVLTYRVSGVEVYKNTGCPRERYTKIHAYVLVPKSFTKFMFPTVYRVTQKTFLCTSVHFNVGPCCSPTDI